MATVVAGTLSRIAGPVLALVLCLCGAALAQETPGPSNVGAPILTLNQERLYTESLYGQKRLAEYSEISRKLAQRNRQVTAELTIEERELTQQRPNLTPEEFRELADAFDKKVTRLRDEQDANIRALQVKQDQDRREFNGKIAAILTALVREAGAFAILDERAVILSADQIDVTDQAITRIDAELGDGGLNAETAPEASGTTEDPAPE